MSIRGRGIALAVITTAFCAFAATASATTIDPLTWEQLVDKADFVGVVECTVAGGIVAKYRVAESLKGSPKPGSELALEIAVNYREPQFPMVLVGEKYFVPTFKSPPHAMVSTSSGGPVPLWWRRIPSDYRFPLFQGMYRLADDGRPFELAFDETKYDALDKFLQGVAKFVSAEEEKRECIMLKSVVRKRLGPDGCQEGIPQLVAVKEALKKVRVAKDVASVVAVLVEAARQSTKDGQRRVTNVLCDGGKATWKVLQGLPRDDWPLSEEQDKRIEEALNPKPRPLLEPQPDEIFLAPLPEGKLAELRGVLARHEKDKMFEAIAILARHAPATAAAYLIAWQNTGKAWHDDDMGYFFGSVFAHLCGKDRPLHLKSLLKANDPFIRVAGAVCLCFEDEKQGVDELKKLTSLKGDPGVWAALNLARRGDTTAVPRAMKVLQKTGDSGSGRSHGNLQKRLKVLLSNSARASGIDQPVEAESRDPEETEESRSRRNYEAYAKWWDENKLKIKLTDPWLELLVKQKVD